MIARPEPRRHPRSQTVGSRGSLSVPGNLRGWLAAVCIALAVVALFSPALKFPFLNWDDHEVFVRNTGLHEPGLLHWAFSTTYIDHYQPLAWLAWGAVDRLWTLTPAAAHALNVVLHALCAALVFALAHRLTRRVGVAVVAALLFALHPLRVEVVAWASAMPYALALGFALLSAPAFLDARERWPMLAASVALFAISLLSRPIALGLPLVFLALARVPECCSGRPSGRRDGLKPVAGRATKTDSATPSSSETVAIVSCTLLAVVAAVVESQARAAGTMTGLTPGARLTLALSAPFRYLLKTIAPVGLTPLDPLALAPRADAAVILIAGAALIGVSCAAWTWRRRFPGAAVAWLAYLALLAPAAGLLPSGLQATADRYSYLPSVPLSIAVAAALGAAIERLTNTTRRAVLYGAAVTLIAAFGITAFVQTRYWRDSVTLWTRAIEIDPASDVALYNLASALADEGRRDEALARYEDVLKIVPDQAEARRNRDLLLAARTEDEGNRLAASGDLDAAIDAYRRVIALDPARTHAQASLGIALVQRGRTSEALPPLREAIKRGSPEAAVPNALAFVLMKEGRTREACEVLESARARFPGDTNVARNLAQLECR